MKKNAKIKIDKSRCAAQDRMYRQIMPQETSRVRENIEWTVTYTYNALDRKNPRVLLIGDSICNGYQSEVRSLLGDKMNVSFWAGSKCVTDPDYFRELSFILHSCSYDIISFNNGLHSLTTDREEWESAYSKALKLIRKAAPDSKLVLTLSTPLRPAEKTAISRALNEIVLKIAEKEYLPVIDLFTPMDALDRETNWCDDYHFLQPARAMQAQIIVKHVLALLPAEKCAKDLKQTGSATGPSGRIE